MIPWRLRIAALIDWCDRRLFEIRLERYFREKRYLDIQETKE